MKKQLNKAVAILASATLILSLSAPAFADSKALNQFTDVSGHWAISDLSSMVDRGIMGGYPDKTMRPQQPVTMAESIKLINKSLDLKGSGNVSAIKYTDVKKNAWYSNEIAIAVENGYLLKVAPGSKLNPNAAATREQLSSMFVQAMDLKAKDNSALNKFKDSSRISSILKADMAAAVEKGLFGGYEDLTIRPTEKVIRATLAAVANRTIIEREKDQKDEIVLGANDMLVQNHGETVSGKTVDTLWINPTNGKGNIILENVNAKKVIVMGEKTVLEIKSTVAPVDKETRAKVAQTSSVIQEIEVRVANVKIIIGKGSKVNLITLKLAAKNAVITGDGTLEKVVIEADNATLNVIGAKFTVAKDVKGTTVNGQSVEANTSGAVTADGFKKDSITSSSSGGGGGGSSTPLSRYAFIASKDGSNINIVEKSYSSDTKMSYQVVKDVYESIGNLSDEAIAKAMPTVKEILDQKNAEDKTYVSILDSKIKTNEGLAVFTGNVALYVSEIAGGNVENMNLLTKELLKAGLDSVLADLNTLFPNSKIPANISVKVIGTDGTLKSLTDDTLKNAKTTIDSQLGAVTFGQADGKTIVEIGIDGSSKKLSLDIKKV